MGNKTGATPHKLHRTAPEHAHERTLNFTPALGPDSVEATTLPSVNTENICSYSKDTSVGKWLLLFGYDRWVSLFGVYLPSSQHPLWLTLIQYSMSHDTQTNSKRPLLLRTLDSNLVNIKIFCDRILKWCLRLLHLFIYLFGAIKNGLRSTPSLIVSLLVCVRVCLGERERESARAPLAVQVEAAHLRAVTPQPPLDAASSSANPEKPWLNDTLPSPYPQELH